MAHLEKHGDGWRVVWWTAGRGSKRAKSETVARKADAGDAMRRIEAQQALLKPIGAGSVLTWAQLIDRYCAHLEAKGAIAQDYPGNVRKSMEWLVADRGWKTTADVIPGAAGVLKVSQHRYLKALLRFAQMLNQPVDARATRLPPPKQKRKPRPALYTDAEVAALLKRAGLYCAGLAAAGHLVATYGHRPESLVKIAVRDVLLDAVPPTITLEVKGGDRIRHSLWATTVTILRPLVEGRQPGDRLLLRPDGDPWKSGESLSTYWWHQVGEHVTPDRPGIYNLKRRAITRLKSEGHNNQAIASVTGHRYAASLDAYVTTNQDMQDAIITSLAKR